MKRAALILVVSVLCLQAAVSLGKEKSPCRIENMPQKVDSLRSLPFFLVWTLDSIHCEGFTVELWMNLHEWEMEEMRTLIVEQGVSFSDAMWYNSLVKFFTVGREAFSIFPDADKYRVVSYVVDKQKSEDDAVKERKVPLSSFRMSRSTHVKTDWGQVAKTNWEYTKRIYAGSGYNECRVALFAFLDGYWVNKEFYE